MFATPSDICSGSPQSQQESGRTEGAPPSSHDSTFSDRSVSVSPSAYRAGYTENPRRSMVGTASPRSSPPSSPIPIFAGFRRSPSAGHLPFAASPPLDVKLSRIDTISKRTAGVRWDRHSAAQAYLKQQYSDISKSFTAHGGRIQFTYGRQATSALVYQFDSGADITVIEEAVAKLNEECKSWSETYCESFTANSNESKLKDTIEQLLGLAPKTAGSVRRVQTY